LENRNLPSKLLGPTLIVIVFSGLNILVGFFTQLLLASHFGTTQEMDVYITASAVPALVNAVLLGSLSVTLIPIYIEYQVHDGRQEAWHIANSFLNLVALVLIVLAIGAMVCSVQIAGFIAPGYGQAAILLTSRLLRIMLPGIVFSGIAGLLAGLSYAHHQFLLPSVALVVNSLTICVITLAFAGRFGIQAVAAGMLAGNIVQCLLFLPWVIRRFDYTLSLDLKNEGVRRILQLSWPLIFASVIFRANIVIDRIIASTLPQGSVSYLGYAYLIVTILLTISTQGISVTIFPLLSKYAASREMDRLKQAFLQGIRLAALMILPLSAVLIALRVPLIQVTFERGEFNHNDTLAVASALVPYLIAMVFMGLGSVVSQGYYVFQDTRTLAKVGVIQIVGYVVYTYLLAGLFSYIGIAIASSMLYGISLLVNFRFLTLRLNRPNMRSEYSVLLRILISASASALAAAWVNALLASLPPIVSLFASGGAAALVYLLLLRYVFAIDDLSMLDIAIRRRIDGLLGKVVP
jgi:putative peptidoglycan lipid II flippase